MGIWALFRLYLLHSITMKITFYIISAQIFCLCLVAARPQNLVIDTGSSIQEVKPEEKEAVLNEFQGRSILYQSLPDFFPPPNHVINVEVESPVLVLTRPEDRETK